jgi:hypothetical protein
MSSTSNQRSVNFDEANAQELRSMLREFGFARVTGAFANDSVQDLRRAVKELMDFPPESGNLTWRSPTVDGGAVIQRISRANLFSQRIADFADGAELLKLGSWIFDKPIAEVRIATGAEGSDGIVLVIKDPANHSIHRDLHWHRDETFTGHLPINPFVNCGLYLDSSDSERGGLLVLPGSHRFRTYDALQETINDSPHEVCVSAQPGDLVVHRADILHRSGPHRINGEIRRVLYANIYFR